MKSLLVLMLCLGSISANAALKCANISVRLTKVLAMVPHDVRQTGAKAYTNGFFWDTERPASVHIAAIELKDGKEQQRFLIPADGQPAKVCGDQAFIRFALPTSFVNESAYFQRESVRALIYKDGEVFSDSVETVTYPKDFAAIPLN